MALDWRGQTKYSTVRSTLDFIKSAISIITVLKVSLVCRKLFGEDTRLSEKSQLSRASKGVCRRRQTGKRKRNILERSLSLLHCKRLCAKSLYFFFSFCFLSLRSHYDSKKMDFKLIVSGSSLRLLPPAVQPSVLFFSSKNAHIFPKLWICLTFFFQTHVSPTILHPQFQQLRSSGFHLFSADNDVCVCVCLHTLCSRLS